MKLGNIIYQKLEDLSEISQEGDGVTRLPFTAEHQRAIVWLKDLMHDAHLTTRIDNIGNLIGEYKSPKNNAKTLIMGSHQDSVINGGKYDGALGVVLPIICFKYVYETCGDLDYNFKIIAFSDEEGIRFSTAFLGSQAVSGSFPPELLERKGIDGKPLLQTLKDFGLTPDISQCKLEGDSFLELHIEQGPVLENKNYPLGIVQAIQSILRYQVEITGFSGHSGTVPMDMRQDAGVGAAEVIVKITEFAESISDIVITIGSLDLYPGAVNVIPGKSNFTVDIRSMDKNLTDQASQKLTNFLEETCHKRNLTFTLEQKMRSATTLCSPSIIDALKQSMEKADVPVYLMASGAGHDTQEMAKIMEAGMLFIRCDKGISHNPLESVTPEDINTACRVITEYLKHY